MRTAPETSRAPRLSRPERETMVLDTAARLFYARGVHEVGMDELVRATGLGKATVYRLYPTKDALVAAYLRRLAATIGAAIEKEISAREGDPGGALLAILDAIEADLRRPGFRGCPFNNASIEFDDPQHPARVQARAYREQLRATLTRLAVQLAREGGRPGTGGQAGDGESLGAQLAVLIDGAYTSAAHLGPDGPAAAGLGLARHLVQQARARPVSDGYEHVLIEDRAQWRAWLEANHGTSPGIWLVTWKKASGRPSLGYDAIVEEALAYGWVDSRPRSIDGQRSARLLTPRRPASNWSARNKARIEQLTAAGRMHAAGLAAVTAAKANGAWTALDETETLAEPADLVAALDATPGARRHWDAFPRSARRAILEWITNAKTSTTRQARIQRTAGDAARNIRANQWRQPTGRRLPRPAAPAAHDEHG